MTIYYIDAAVGNDANAGTAEGAGNAFATLGAAEAVIVGGDHVYVKASGTYTENLVLTNSFATSADTVIFEGYTTTPGDGGVATMDPASGVAISSNFLTRNFRIWKNLRLTGATYGYQDDSGDYAMFINCEFDNCSTDGVLCDNYATFINCSFHDNAQNGVQCDQFASFINCVSYGNGGSNYLTWGGIYINCLSFGMPSAASQACIGQNSNSSPYVVYGCTLDAEGDTLVDGVHANGGATAAIINNIIIDAAVGIDLTGSTAMRNCIFHDYNLFNGCATDVDADFDNTEGNNITGSDPLFTDEAGDDYTLTSGSPAENAGMATRTS